MADATMDDFAFYVGLVCQHYFCDVMERRSSATRLRSPADRDLYRSDGLRDRRTGATDRRGSAR